MVGSILDTEVTSKLKFDCALALHACGSLTDACMQTARKIGASFVISPCCVGKMTDSITKGSAVGL